MSVDVASERHSSGIRGLPFYFLGKTSVSLGFRIRNLLELIQIVSQIPCENRKKIPDLLSESFKRKELSAGIRLSFRKNQSDIRIKEYSLLSEANGRLYHKIRFYLCAAR